VLLAVWSGVSDQMRRMLDALTLADVASMARGERDWPVVS
jgi:DNA-binding IscR family transcriptional regulator